MIMERNKKEKDNNLKTMMIEQKDDDGHELGNKKREKNQMKFDICVHTIFFLNDH